MTKRLVVNADDFGMAVEVSRGIMQAARDGIVRGASAMANCPDFDASMDELEQGGGALDLGFHANLTWGRPVSDPKQIPTITDSVGNLLPRGRLFAKALLGLVSPEEVYRELWAQCAKLSKRLDTISHLDGHHHVHVLPGVADAVGRVAREFRIPYVRSPREGLWSPWHRQSLGRFGIFMLAASNPDYWRRRGFLSSDSFGGFSLGAKGDLKGRWMETIDKLPEGVSEIMVHPGFDCRGLDDYSRGREDEVPVLMDPELSERARAGGIDLVSFSDLAAR